MRASAVVEKAGIPTASLVCEGFLRQASATAPGLGIASLPVARLVGHVDSQSEQELCTNVAEVTAAEVIRCLTTPPAANEATQHFVDDEIVAHGSFDAINALFEERQWSDGLPIVPPTPQRVAAFMDQAADAADRIIGVLKPSGSAATVHNVAVNGVMAGCRAQYMPVLVAIAEILSDPCYGVEHSGDTTGGDAQIILSGPAVAALGFNTAEGALRDGHRANSSVGRFLRLYLRNVAGFLPGAADKATHGHNYRVVLAENAAAVASLGWRGFHQEQGFAAEDSVVTIGRFTGDTVIGSIFGHDAETILAYLGDGLVRQTGWESIFIAGFATGTHHPLVVLSPLVAHTLSRAGLSRRDVQEGLFRSARLPAQKLETYLGRWANLVPGRQSLAQMVAAGTAPALYADNDDPNRLVPIVARAEDILIVVSGDPQRSNAMALGSNGMHGLVTSRRLRSPRPL